MDTDHELVAAIVLEISDRFKLLLKFFPEETEPLLRHLAGCSLHLSFFVRDFMNHKNNRKGSEAVDLIEQKFLDSCGCKEKKNDEVAN